MVYLAPEVENLASPSKLKAVLLPYNYRRLAVLFRIHPTNALTFEPAFILQQCEQV